MTYDPPDHNNVPFRFTSGGYVVDEEILFNFGVGAITSTSANLRSLINVMGTYQNSTYSYIKRCPKYVVGYSTNGIQIIQGPCEYGGIRDLGAYLNGLSATLIRNLGGYITGVISSYDDLIASAGGHLPDDISARIVGWVHAQEDISGDIHGWQQEELQAIIDNHSPANLQAYVDIMSRSPSDMPASVYGWQASDLTASMNMIYSRLLNAIMNPVVGVDLPAYLKVYPQDILPANIYGWHRLNLSAAIQAMQRRDLGAYIGVHLWRDLGVLIKGWGREEPLDLPASIGGFTYDDLSAYIRAKYLSNLTAYLYAIQPVDLGAAIHGWQALDLPAILNGLAYEYDLRASINPSGELRLLSAYIRGVITAQETVNLPSSIHSWEMRDLGSYLNSIRPGILSATLNAIGTSTDLPAIITPRMIRLTSILSLSTMEHKDLAAIINSECLSSMFVDLQGYINTVFKSDLYASIVGVTIAQHSSNLGATVGYSPNITHVDRFPISINLYRSNYRAEDMLPIQLNVFRQASSFTASIFGEYRSTDISAYITGEELDPYEFSNPMNREIVYKLSPRQVVEHFRIVELSFRSTVDDYFYFSTGNVSYKTDRFDRWVLDVKSYIPANIRIGTPRKLHRTAVIGNLGRFSTMDEAVKYAIAFVTDEPQVDLSAYINGVWLSHNLSATINSIYIKSSQSSLGCTITPVGNRVVVGMEDEVDVL